MKIYLVGAGPGDPDLLTVKAARLLKSADVILHDYLVPGEILELAQKKAKKISVGKKKGACPKTQQDLINQLMIKYAKTGLSCVRLKCGDPFVYGRGAEECLALAKEGITPIVVPGITSSISVLSNAMIPVTDRTLASSFAIFSGHAAQGKSKATIDWEIAAKIPTAVFLMAIKPFEEIISKLIEYGRPATTPIAVVTNGTRTNEDILVSTLAEVLEHKDSLSSPAVVIVGEVVNIRSQVLNLLNLCPNLGEQYEAKQYS